MKLLYKVYYFLAILLIAVPLTALAESRVNAPPPSAPQPPAATDITPQAAYLQINCPLTEKFQGVVGLYAKNLKTGQLAILNPDKVFAAASTIKVPVSVIVYRHFYDQASPATRNVYDTGVELMMTISDNDYFAEFLDEIEEIIGPDNIRQHFAQLGMSRTTIRDPKARSAFGYSNVTSPRDMGLFFEQLYLGNLLDAEKTEFMKNALANTIFNDELPRYLQDRRILHKIGELDDVLADVGIVESPDGPILISIFTETPLDVDYASDYIAAMSACVYNLLTGEAVAWKSPAAS